MGASKTARLNTGGIQLAAFLVSRCLFASGDAWVWMTLMPCAEMLQDELYRVATLIVSEDTATNTIRAHQGRPRRSPKYVGRNISGPVSNSGRFYHTKKAHRKQTEKLRGNYLDNYVQTLVVRGLRISPRQSSLNRCPGLAGIAPFPYCPTEPFRWYGPP